MNKIISIIVISSLLFTLGACANKKSEKVSEKINVENYCEKISELKKYVSVKGNEVEQLNSALTFSTQIKTFIKETSPESEKKLWNEIAKFEYARGLEEIDIDDANKVLASYEKINSILKKRCAINFFDI